MRINSKANRGRTFEEYLKRANERYEKDGIAVVHKVPTEFLPIRNRMGQVSNCKVEHKSCVDFLGRYKNIPVAIEAKHTENNRIAFSRIEDHQAEFLDKWDLPGAAALVLVSFGMNRFFAIPWVFWKTARDAWHECPKKKVEVRKYGWIWTTPGMASACPEQLLDEWEIKPGGVRVLPYMKIVDSIITHNNDFLIYGKEPS